MSTDKEAAGWDRTSDLYAENCNPFCVLHAYDLVKAVFSSSEKSSKPCNILDVGCGAGAVAQAYQRLFPNGVQSHTFTCTDISPGMIENARRVVSLNPNGQTKFEFRVEDATQLAGVPDQSIDVVLSAFAIFLVPDRKAAMNQVQRVLKPGGSFAMAAWTGIPELPKGFGLSFETVFFSIVKALCPSDQMEKMMKDENDENKPWEQWRDIERGKTFYSEAGFTNIRTWKTLHTASFTNVKAIFDTAKSTPMIDPSTLSNETIEDAFQKFKSNLKAMDLNSLEGMLLLVNASNIFLGYK